MLLPYAVQIYKHPDVISEHEQPKKDALKGKIWNEWSRIASGHNCVVMCHVGLSPSAGLC